MQLCTGVVSITKPTRHLFLITFVPAMQKGGTQRTTSYRFNLIGLLFRSYWPSLQQEQSQSMAMYEDRSQVGDSMMMTMETEQYHDTYVGEYEGHYEDQAFDTSVGEGGQDATPGKYWQILGFYQDSYKVCK